MADAKFGPGQITKQTPLWAKWMFRITFGLTTAVVAWVAATKLFPLETKYEITIFLKLLVDPLIFMLSKMFGVSLKDEEQ